MKTTDLKTQWQADEAAAFQGWYFSYISNRWCEPAPPWDYSGVVKSHLDPAHKLLDMGTGGGEVLLSIGHPHQNTYATEAWPPNFELCVKTLTPLGITMAQTYEDDKLPFDNNSFDIIINRHESFDLEEVNRTLRPGGYFITQQVGGKNTREFMKLLNDDFLYDLPHHTVENYVNKLKLLGFNIEKSEEAEYPVKVYDVGALVYQAKVIEWEYPNFSVETHFEKLLACHKIVQEKGYLEATGHRFLIVAKKA